MSLPKAEYRDSTDPSKITIVEPGRVSINGEDVAAGSSVAGSDKQFQFNDNGALGAVTGLTWDKTTQQLALSVSTADPASGFIAALNYVGGAFSGFIRSVYAAVGILSGTQNCDSMAAILVESGFNFGSGVLTNNYGLQINSQAGVGTNNAAVHIEDQGNGAHDYAIKSEGGKIKLALPTADPHVAGVLWADSGAVKVSAG